MIIELQKEFVAEGRPIAVRIIVESDYSLEWTSHHRGRFLGTKWEHRFINMLVDKSVEHLDLSYDKLREECEDYVDSAQGQNACDEIANSNEK